MNAIVGRKYEKFRDENATIILDVEEERAKLELGIEDEVEIEGDDDHLFRGISLERRTVRNQLKHSHSNAKFSCRRRDWGH